MFADRPYAGPRTPDWWVEQLDSVHGLPSVAAVLAECQCCGVSRFYDGGEECPDRLLTCSWTQLGVWIEAVQACSTWGSPGPQLIPPIFRWTAWVPRHLMFGTFRDWPTAISAFAAAPSCDRNPMGMGGLMCHHAWASPIGSDCVGWMWPDERLDRRQWWVINAYRWLRQVGWLCSWRSPPVSIKARRTNRCTTIGAASRVNRIQELTGGPGE